MSAVRSKSAIVVEEETQSRPARGGQVLACEPVEHVLLLECIIFQVSYQVLAQHQVYLI